MSSREALVAEAEGLRLHLSRTNSTGYKGVKRLYNGRFQAEHGRHDYIGCFGSAVEAAVAYARAVGEYQPPTVAAEAAEGRAEAEAAAVVAEAEGVRLHLSSSNSTGYKCVYKRPSGRFLAVKVHGGDGNVSLGTFGTPVDAAVAYARAVGEPAPLEEGAGPAAAAPAAPVAVA
ncbi:hypothetical protein EMIHUDRAFT_349937, partial [Emiliania huxleyi CCMP1516]|uniref:AP2/ERF domain-containing protein n=2 Tax=Emiliania huxleyi TaxID=2903 RepID=A0A0D3J423_EMIH1